MNMSTNSSVSVHSICRICLTDLKYSRSYDLFLESDLSKKLAVCTNLSVDPQDGFPKNICANCFARLNDLHDFQKLCIESMQRFRELVTNVASKRIACKVDTVNVFEPVAMTSNELEPDVLDKDDQTYDPLLNHKMELIENEDEVFKMLETVDKEAQEVEKEVGKQRHKTELSNEVSSSDSSSSDDDLPLSHRLVGNQNIQTDSESEQTRQRFKHKRVPPIERRQHRIKSCQVCQQKFKKQYKYDEHMKHHNELLPYQCTVETCRKGFTTPGALRLHVDYAHTKGSEVLPCIVDGCKQVFPRVRLLTIHLKKVHNMVRASTPRAEQSCNECGTVFRCPVALKKHMYKHTGEELPYPCNICGKGFHINSALKNHLLRHAGIKNYVCPYCGVGKTTRQEWSKHILTHTQEKMFKCHLCEHATHSKRALDNHVKIVHEKIRNFGCQYCGKTFGKSHACKIHEMTHTGEKRCECKVCGKKFLYTESLTKHLKTHEKSVDRAIETYRQRQEKLNELSGETATGVSNVCTLNENAADQLLKACAESVATIPRDPRRVERVDITQLAGTVVNPIPSVFLSSTDEPKVNDAPRGMHICPGCNRGFNNLGNMKRHYKSVHEKVKDFECRFCSRRFANSQSLKQHEWIHTGEKPYACRTCGTHFRQEAALIRHQKVHDDKPEKPGKPPKEMTTKVREKQLQKSERRRKVEQRRNEIATAAKEQLENLAKQRALEKNQNTYEQYQAAAAAAEKSVTEADN